MNGPDTILPMTVVQLLFYHIRVLRISKFLRNGLFYPCNQKKDDKEMQ